MPSVCTRQTEYDKLLLDCDAASDRMHEAVGKALSEYSGSTNEQFRHHVVLAFDTWKDIHYQLMRYRHQKLQDSCTQTEIPQYMRKSAPTT